MHTNTFQHLFCHPAKKVFSHIYYSFIQNGSVYFSQEDFDKHLSSIGFVVKGDNCIGLQIADVLPSALLRKINYAKLAKAKPEEMKVDLAYQTLNTINGLEDEAQAVELLTGKYAELRDTSLSAVEAMLQVAVAEAHNRGEKQGQAADMIMQVYQNQKKSQPCDLRNAMKLMTL